MTILDSAGLLSEEEKTSYHSVLKLHGHESDHFLLEVEEDQGSIDMNDLDYVVIIKTKATHVGHQKTKAYFSRAGSATWLTEFEEDLKKGYFTGE
ncbi:MAG TPA: hypothetical protein VMW10_04490 [Alphaproteobacteria bacterium]|nr:hypothetical protein [Alphaproteobacteria bacterium]